jgi:hypothetical protein
MPATVAVGAREVLGTVAEEEVTASSSMGSPSPGIVATEDLTPVKLSPHGRVVGHRE